MIPAWKLKRELTRLRVQLKGIPQAFYEPFLQWQHDRQRNQSFTGQDGQVAGAKKIALFLIYQPNDLPASLLQTCDHLVKNGFAPLIVSNSPLSERSKTELLSRCWKFAERKNFGYDFGGYRDGIWLLNQMGICPETLLVLNDSVWFPIVESDTLLYEMEDNHADYVGTQVFTQTGKTNRKWSQPFFGSNCFMVKKAAFQHADFQSFWQNYRLTSNKEKTLHRGERAFSYMMFAAGISSEAIFSIERFAGVVAGLTPEELINALTNLICLAPEPEQRRLALLAAPSDAGWQTDARALICEVSETKNFIGSSPVLSIEKLQFPMIKKNNEMLYKRARRKLIEAHSNGGIPQVDTTILEEMKLKNHT